MKDLGKPIKFIAKLIAIGVFLVVACPSFAQVGKSIGRGVYAGARVPNPREVSQTLKARVNATYQRALEVQQQHAGALRIDGPSKFMFPRLYKKSELIYPDKPFLEGSPKNLTNYFIANNNRQLIRAIPQIHALQNEWWANRNNFQQAQLAITHPAEQDIPWLAGKIPSTASSLLLGEYHGNPYIPEMVGQLLHEIRLRQPDRQIILLTEFLYDDGIQPDWLVEQYTQTWTAAKENDILIAGLEPAFKRREHFYEEGIFYANMRIKPTSLYDANTVTSWENAWCSLEGMRIRNASWLATMQEFRQKYPEALFVIYAGNFHTLFWYPFSLGNALKEENPFIVSFVPEDTETWFDEITQQGFNSSRVLAFGNKKLRDLAGFDVQIRVPR